MSSNSFVKLCSPTSGLNQLPPYSQLPLFPDWGRERLPITYPRLNLIKAVNGYRVMA